MSDRTVLAEDQIPEVGEQGPAKEKVRGAAALFKWSGFVHAGEGAEECAHAEDGKCADDAHFHAWVRMPNQFQNEEITEKADAAKARRLRLLRDPESDARAIMEAAIDELIAGLSDAELVDEILAEGHLDARALAESEVQREAESDLYKHLHTDLERYAALREMGDDRPQEEFDALDKHLDEYFARVNARVKVIQAPKRKAAEAKERVDLRADLLEQRIQAEIGRYWYSTFELWTWIAGTYTLVGKWTNGRPADRYFTTESSLRDASVEAIEAIKGGFSDLYQALRKDAQGN